MLNNIIKLSLPLDKNKLTQLKAGDRVLLSGKMLVFRDAGHKMLFESISQGNQSFDFKGQTIYFMGPCPAQEGEVIGSAGPTTSCRMDKYTPYMLQNGLVAQIGKGKRDEASKQAFVKNKRVYFIAIGGAGAYYQKSIKSAKVVCYPQLGTEAVREITVQDFAVIVGIDTSGNDVYDRKI